MGDTIRSYISLIDQRMKQVLHERLLPYNITPQQARVVGFVGTQQERGQLINQRDIEDAFELTGPSITSLLQGLERREFIMRRSDPTDERRKVVIVLPKGLDLVHDFEAVFDVLDQALVQGLTAEQQRSLVDVLKHLAHNLE